MKSTSEKIKYYEVYLQWGNRFCCCCCCWLAWMKLSLDHPVHWLTRHGKNCTAILDTANVVKVNLYLLSFTRWYHFQCPWLYFASQWQQAVKIESFMLQWVCFQSSWNFVWLWSTWALSLLFISSIIIDHCYYPVQFEHVMLMIAFISDLHSI